MRGLVRVPLALLAAGFVQLLDCANELRLARLWKWFAVVSRWLAAALLVIAVIAAVAHRPAGSVFADAACMFGLSLFADIFFWACGARKAHLAGLARAIPDAANS